MSRLTREKGFTFKQDGEHGFRRVVASPAPLRILEAAAIKVRNLQVQIRTRMHMSVPEAVTRRHSGPVSWPDWC